MASKAIWESRPQLSSPPGIEIPSPTIDGWSCGQNWGELEIRQPYKDVDYYVEVLPRLSGAARHDLTGEKDHYDRARIAREWVQDGTIDGVIDHAREILSRYPMDDANKAAVQSYINMASKYAENAKALWNYWSKTFVPEKTPADPKKAPNMVHVAGSPHWILTRRAYPGCAEDMAWPDIGSLPVTELDGGYGGDRDFLDVACPHIYETLAHRADAQIYYDLLVATINNARCAAEAAAAVGVFYKNRSRIVGKIHTPIKSKTKHGTGATAYDTGVRRDIGEYAPLRPDEPHPPVIGGAGVESDSSGQSQNVTESKSKKKNNTVLIAAAAGAALFLFGRR